MAEMIDKELFEYIAELEARIERLESEELPQRVERLESEELPQRVERLELEDLVS